MQNPSQTDARILFFKFEVRGVQGGVSHYNLS